MRSKLLIFLVALLASTRAFAVEEAITTAYYAGDKQQLETLSSETEQSGYLSAYLDWRLGSLLFNEGSVDEADAVMQRGQETLQRLTVAKPDQAEAWALLAVTIGMRIGVGPGARGMKMGPASSRAGKKALKLEPDNARALLIAGINKLNTPALFGGGKKKALKYLDRALASWQNNRPGRHEWGEADIYVWRGQTHQALDHNLKACADFAGALAVAPKFEWAALLYKQLDCTTVAAP